MKTFNLSIRKLQKEEIQTYDFCKTKSRYLKKLSGNYTQKKANRENITVCLNFLHKRAGREILWSKYRKNTNEN